MDNDLRLAIQGEILDLLACSYYSISCFDYEEAHTMARADSYKIMGIIGKHIEIKDA